MITNLEAGTTLELDEVGRPIRLTTTSQSFGYVPSEYGPVEVEVLISYEVAQFSMPDERDIQRLRLTDSPARALQRSNC